MNKKELKFNEKSQNKTTSKNRSNLTSHISSLTSNFRGITLIALVITIIVMLILVAVTVSVAINGGLFNTAKKATRETQIAGIKEMVQEDIWTKMTENNGGELTAEQLREVLDKYFDGVPNSGEELEEQMSSSDYSLETKEEYGPKVEIKVSDLYNGTLAKDNPELPEELGDSAGTETSYVGYYADVNGDDKADGIIYADLAVEGNGQWSDNGSSDFSYTASEKKLKEYMVTGEDSSFGGVTRDVIKAVPGSAGEDRFYVMALEDVDEEQHYWYKSAYGKLDDLVETDENDFGKGKENTKTMIDKWNSKSYGEQGNNDLWELIQQETTKTKYPTETWFVPSKAEWAAFGWTVYRHEDENGFGVDETNYSDKFHLKDWYWSSSLNDSNNAYDARFTNGYIYSLNVSGDDYVRLSATF